MKKEWIRGMEEPKTTWGKSIKRQTVNTSPIQIDGKLYGDPTPKTVEEVVSMRCSRHHKRFEVPKRWLKTCDYLCPRCYDRLSAAERMAYAPRKSIDASCKKSAFCDKSTLLSAEVKVPKDGPKQQTRQKSEVSQERSDAAQRVFKDSDYDFLLPRYKIACHMCGEVVPCHYVWFEKSTVLCPACYGKLTDKAIKMFHAVHKAEKPHAEYDIDMTVANERRPYGRACLLRRDIMNEAASSINEECWTTERIMRVTKEELLNAVKRGKVSKVRARIELTRRDNIEYFDLFPEEVGIEPIRFHM